jgi:transposase
LNENQLFLFAAKILKSEAKESASKDEPDSDRLNRKANGRQRLPKSLKQQRVVFDLAEHEKQRPICQDQLRRIGEESSERLQYEPASSMIVIEEVCQKYAFKNGCTVVTAGKPMVQIEKGLPGPGLPAQPIIEDIKPHMEREQSPS